MFESLIAHWGYAAIALGAFVEGEAVLLAAGALAQHGALSLPLVVCAGALGSVGWAQLWFRLGRRFGRAALERRPAWQARSEEMRRWLARYGAGFVLGFRFVSGIGTAAPVLLGASGYRLARFTAVDVIGAGLWAAAFSSAGFGAGAGLKRLLGRPAGWPEAIAAGIALALAIGLGLRFARARMSRPS